MALADPQSVTIGAATTPLPRVSVGPNASTYSSADSTVQLSASHAYGKRIRRTARVTSTKITTDPLLTNVNVRVSASAYVVLDVPTSGFTAAEQNDLLLSIATWLSATSGANAAKLIGGEN